MKKNLIGAIVGGIIIFIWQFLSFAAIDLHKANNQYTPNQDAVINAITSNIAEEGGYSMPNLPPGSTWDDHEVLMKNMEGKPTVHVLYHKSYENTMTMNMIRGLLSNIIMVWLLCWIIGKINLAGFGTVFGTCLAIGLITFINQPYTGHIWYRFFDTKAHLLDAIASWGLCGLWLGWWLTKRRVA